MNPIKTTIVTVCYNAVDNIENTVLSVISQTYNNIEYIVIDGGSNDGTIEIIKKYSENITRWISEPDKGIYDAMNKGIQISTGDYILFLNAGDSLYSKNTISDVSKKITSKAIYYGDVYRIYDKYTNLYGGKFSSYRLTFENICHQSIFYPTEYLKKRPYTTKYRLLADWEMNMNLYNKYSFVYLDIPISNYLMGGVSDMSSDDKFIKDYRYIIFKSFGPIIFLRHLIGASNKLLNKIITRSRYSN